MLSLNSSSLPDCYLNKDEFLFDENDRPTVVSGCPPDAFSDDGQLWGTPIYNFEKMKENGYRFLVNRISFLASHCHYLRLDHFRAFDTYCVIPAEDDNARRGRWLVGPRYDFFDTLFREHPDIKIIAEDLGEMFDSVIELRDHYNLPGMRVYEFCIFDDLPISDKFVVPRFGYCKCTKIKHLVLRCDTCTVHVGTEISRNTRCGGANPFAEFNTLT